MWDGKGKREGRKAKGKRGGPISECQAL